MNQIWIGSQSTSAIVYTVPSGKYFKGYIGHNSSPYVKVNGVQIHNYWNNAFLSSNEANAGTEEVVLVAGSPVAAGYSNGNWLMVL